MNLIAWKNKNFQNKKKHDLHDFEKVNKIKSSWFKEATKEIKKNWISDSRASGWLLQSKIQSPLFCGNILRFSSAFPRVAIVDGL